MTRSVVVRIVGGVVVAFLSVAILALSLGNGSLYPMSPGERDARATIPITTRIDELFMRPLLPGHPLYLVKMLRDQSLLLLSQGSARIERKIVYAGTRRTMAELLIGRSQQTLALTTLTKSSKYLLGASQDLRHFDVSWDDPLGRKLEQAIREQIAVMTLMKPSFSDGQKATIDELISQLSVTLPTR